ncbi:hypothetical protein CJF30_00011186 [Rutstroemia sp. NJR-2017a BBW]|nr:hypothetical protein CJF30_00011186 [Rutstroemia sp. NJR-2017a BBW]
MATTLRSVLHGQMDRSSINTGEHVNLGIKPKKIMKSKNKFALAFASLYDEENGDFVAPPQSNSTKNDGLPLPDAPADITQGSKMTVLPVEAGDVEPISQACSEPDDICKSASPVDESEFFSSTSNECSDGDSIDSDSTLVEEHNGEEAEIKIRHEWTGTSIYMLDSSMDIQRENDLDQLIQYRAALLHDQSLTPYDPSFYIDLSQVDSKLGFCDTSASLAHRSLLLTEAGLQLITSTSTSLSRLVYTSIANRLNTTSPILIIDELHNLYCKGYRWLCNALLVCGTFWDGLLTVKKGLALFPDDEELLDLKLLLTDAFRERSKNLVGSRNALVASRSGRILQRKYPWMDGNLFSRSRELLDHINATFPSTNAQIRPVIASSELPTENVGPLGIFATRNIQPDEQILLDKSVIVTSNILPSTLTFCDACHAALIFPFMHPSEVVRPTCSCRVAFCSHSCYDLAVKGYHNLQCGKDFDWLYSGTASSNAKPAKKTGSDPWLPKLFLRLMSIVLTTPGFEPHSRNQKHPLTHTLLARMTANYPVGDKTSEAAFDWSFDENIQTPLKILVQLGIDIWEPKQSSFWSQDVLQTIFWRLENNVNTSVMDLRDLGVDSGTDDGKVHLTVLSPNYLFFNHSCRANTSWHGTVPNIWVEKDWLFVEGVGEGMGGEGWVGERGKGNEKEMLVPGSGSVVCRAGGVIQEGEELKISYVGDPMGEEDDAGEDTAEGKKPQSGKGREQKRHYLMKWFDEGCGCDLCEEENKAEKKNDEMKVERD